MKTRGHAPGSGSGATLIEVVVTIGILITTLVPLVGLLSTAIDTSGKAASTTISARVAARITGEVQQSDWAGLQTWAAREMYFDDQGKELTGATAAQEAVYTARVRLGTSGVVMGTGAGSSNSSLRQVVVMVASLPAPRGKISLDEAEAAITTGKDVPKQVRISRAMLVNLERPPGT
ncbi:MAG TPA: Verru_Chthon cassette protein B [Candidatus Saccharimonadia bacterium]|nr:Verru_Chthon cassette protein B [Candidatus Saccharimonadia bacterium]